MSEGQTWSSEDTRLLVSKSFLVPARSSICLPSLRSALTAAVSQRQNALSSLGKVCSLLMTSRSTAESGLNENVLPRKQRKFASHLREFSGASAKTWVFGLACRADCGFEDQRKRAKK
jgi:hypothetical protein